MGLDLPIDPSPLSILDSASRISDHPVKISDVPHDARQLVFSKPRSLQKLNLFHLALIRYLSDLSANAPMS